MAASTTCPSPVARVVQGGEETDDEVQGAARVVPEEVGGDDGRFAGGADHAEGAGEGDVADVVAGAVGERAVLAPAGHPAVHQPGVAGVAVPGTDAEALGHAGAVALDEQVGAFDEVEDAGGAVRGFEVDDHRALVAVGDVVGGVDPQAGAAGAVHADDVRAQVGEEHGGERARPDPGQLDHAHAGERALSCCRPHPALTCV